MWEQWEQSIPARCMGVQSALALVSDARHSVQLQREKGYRPAPIGRPGNPSQIECEYLRRYLVAVDRVLSHAGQSVL